MIEGTGRPWGGGSEEEGRGGKWGGRPGKESRTTEGKRRRKMRKSRDMGQEGSGRKGSYRPGRGGPLWGGDPKEGALSRSQAQNNKSNMLNLEADRPW